MERRGTLAGAWSMTNDQEWRVDRRIPVAIILTLGLQTLAGVWWAATMQNRIETLEDRVNATSDQAARMVKVETILERLERKIDALP